MSLSRRYRPQVFADITDQETIKDTLQKEIATGKLGHAYLFSGPRGVGKTTTARIFAKALNCENPVQGEPCGKCALCLSAQAGSSVDIIEMDAASHTGVDMVREAIIEHVRFAPSRGKYKVYILDEAHMLSTSAWNALLKTLEEPPSYAIFILATTELHKVPATIISRCQRFDFKRLPEAKIAERITELAKEEKVSIDGAVVRSIARHADGCLRDAEVLLDQLIALGEKKITQDVASLVIPISQSPRAAALLEGCARRELSGVLKEIEGCEEDGISFVPLFEDLIHAVRGLLLAADGPAYANSLAAGDEGERRLAQLVGRFSPQELVDMSLVLMERRRDAKQGIDGRFAMELALAAIALGILPHGQPTTTNNQQPGQAPPLAPPSQGGGSESCPPPYQGGVRGGASEQPADGKELIITSASTLTLQRVQQKWKTMIKAVSEKMPSLTFILTISRPIEVRGPVLSIRFQYPFHLDKVVGDGKNKRVIEDCLRKTLGVSELTIEGIVGEDADRAEQRSEDMVTNILKAFGGQVLDSGSSTP